MLTQLLICAMALGTPCQDSTNVDAQVPAESAVLADEVNEDFWNNRKSFRIGYEMHTFQTESGGVMPMKFGVGLSRVRNVWVHKKPIANMLKFSFDHGIAANYGMFAASLPEDSGYNGPLGYLGTETDVYDDSDEETGANSMGTHYFSAGYAVGASVTINPVANLRVNGYFHFVPSAALLFGDSGFQVGFMPYFRYGAELTYGKVGLGLEWGSGVSKMSDLSAKFGDMAEEDSESGFTPNYKYYSNYMQVYLALRFGKNRR